MLYIIILIKKNPAWKDFVHINKFYDIIYLYIILIKAYAIREFIVSLIVATCNDTGMYYIIIRVFILIKGKNLSCD